MNAALQVEQQFSHKFTVTVVRAESVTKGALGDLCESSCKFILVAQLAFIAFARSILYSVKKCPSKRSRLILQCVGSGHARPVCGTVHPNSSREQKKDQTHRQRRQSSMERDLHLHLRPQPTECSGGRLFYYFLAV